MHKKLWGFVKKHWKSGAVWGLFILVASILLLINLGTLFPGASQGELSYIQSISSGRSVVENPDYLPHKLPSYIATKIQFSTTSVRLVSVVFAIGFLVSAWYLMRLVFSKQTAVIGSLLLACSSWFLILGRSALPDSSYFLIPIAAASVIWLIKHIDSWKIVILVGLLITPLLYIPGSIWLAVAVGIYYRTAFTAALKALTTKQRLLFAVVQVILLTPLVIGVILNPSVIISLLGLSTNLNAYTAIPNEFILSFYSLFIRSSENNSMTLLSLPYMDIFSSILIVLGLYRLRYWNRTTLLFSALASLYLILATSIGAIPTSALFVPLYAMVIYGAGFLLRQWYTVFPRNPVARSIGTGILASGILLISIYHLTKFYVAWPNTPEARAQHSQILIK